MISLVRNLLLLMMGYWIFGSICCLSTVVAQQENQVPSPKTGSDPRVESLQDQIRQVKRQMSILGPKHPSWESTNKKLKGLEAQLSAILAKSSNKLTESAPPGSTEKETKEGKPNLVTPSNSVPKTQNLPTDKKPAKDKKTTENQSRTISPKRSGEKPPLSSIAPETRWIYQTLSQLETAPYVGYDKVPKIVEYSARRTSVEWESRFPSEIARGIQRLQFVPKTDTLLSSEFDRAAGVSSLWKWHDSAEKPNKELLWRTPGQILDFYTVSQSGSFQTCYILRRNPDSAKSVELLEITIPAESSFERSVFVESHLATLSLDYPSQGVSSDPFYFSDGLGQTFTVLSQSGFTSEIKDESTRCVQFDPLTLIFWNTDKSPNISQLRSVWMGLSKSSMRNERISLISDSQVISLVDAGKDSRLVVKSLEGKAIRDVLLPQENLVTSSFNRHSLVLAQEQLSKSNKKQKLYFLSENLSSIHNAQDTDSYSSTSEPFLKYPGRIFQLAKDSRGKLVVLTDAGVFETSIQSQPSPQTTQDDGLPLMDTGLFVEIAKLQPREYFLEYFPEVVSGVHGKKSRYFVAFPEDARIADHGQEGWLFPEGTVFLQTPSIESQRFFNQQVDSERIRVLVKSKGQWHTYIYQWGAEANHLPSLAGRQQRDIVIPGGHEAQSVANQNCWECHSRSFNDGIRGFHDSTLALITPVGVLQTELLRKERLLSRGLDDNSRISSAESSDERLRLSEEIIKSVIEIQTAAPDWYSRNLKRLDWDAGLRDASADDLLLCVDAFLATGDKRYGQILEATNWFELSFDYVGRWLKGVTDITTEGTQDSVARYREFESLVQGRLIPLICNHPEKGVDRVYTLVGQAALVYQDLKKQQAISTRDSLLAESRRFSQINSLDSNWTELLLEYYGRTGAAWSLQDARTLLSEFPLMGLDSDYSEVERLTVLRHCLMCLRVWELTGESQFLKTSVRIWDKLHAALIRQSSSLEEAVLKAHCALRLLVLDVREGITQDCLDDLNSLVSILKSSDGSDAQEESSTEAKNEKPATSKAIIESQRIILELLQVRLSQIRE